MYPVGGSQGQTWNFNEGQGEATILKTPLTDNYISNEVLLQSKERKEQAKKDADDFQARIDALNTAYQSADMEMQHATREVVMDYISDLSNARVEMGKNPLLASSVDADSKKYQDGYQQLMALPQMGQQLSTAIKSQIDAYKANPEKYRDDENLKTLQMGLGGGMFQKYVSGEITVPSLKLKAPTADVLGGLSKAATAAGVNIKNAAAVYTSAPFVVESLLNGPDKEKYENSAAQSISERSPEYREALNKRAEDKGVSPVAMYLTESLNSIADSEYTFDSREVELYEATKQNVARFTNEKGSFPKIDEALRLLIQNAEADPKFMADLERKGMTAKQWAETWRDKPFGDTTIAAPKEDKNNSDGLNASGVFVEDWLVKVEQRDPVAMGRVVNAKFPGDPSVRDVGGRDVELGKGTFISIEPIRELNTGGAITYLQPESTFKIKIRLDTPMQVEYKDGTKGGKSDYQTIVVGRDEAKRLFAAHVSDKLNTKQTKLEIGQTGNDDFLNE